MINVGNDIISLHAVNFTRTKQPRFYSKILTDAEVTLYKKGALAEIPFENFVWLLWSLKESAFKYLQRSKPSLIFSPTKFVVKHLSMPVGYTETKFNVSQIEGAGFDHRMAFKGEITFESDTLFSRSLVFEELIVSVVNDHSNFENTWWGIKLIDRPDPKNQSAAVRKFLIDKLKSLYHLEELRIGKDAHGFPIVLQADKEIAISVSLSHHDLLVAYSFSTKEYYCEI
jgi:phosphopantetheinyl transferase (holo-ACP synthase)